VSLPACANRPYWLPRSDFGETGACSRATCVVARCQRGAFPFPAPLPLPRSGGYRNRRRRLLIGASGFFCAGFGAGAVRPLGVRVSARAVSFAGRANGIAS